MRFIRFENTNMPAFSVWSIDTRFAEISSFFISRLSYSILSQFLFLGNETYKLKYHTEFD